MAEETRTTDAGGGGSFASGGSGPRRGRSGPGGGRGRFQSKPKVCLFCVEKGQRVDYKQIDVLRRFVSERGKIRPRRQTGTCARHQRLLSVAIKRARHLAMLPFASGALR